MASEVKNGLREGIFTTLVRSGYSAVENTFAALLVMLVVAHLLRENVTYMLLIVIKIKQAFNSRKVLSTG